MITPEDLPDSNLFAGVEDVGARLDEAQRILRDQRFALESSERKLGRIPTQPGRVATAKENTRELIGKKRRQWQVNKARVKSDYRKRALAELNEMIQQIDGMLRRTPDGDAADDMLALRRDVVAQKEKILKQQPDPELLLADDLRRTPPAPPRRTLSGGDGDEDGDGEDSEGSVSLTVHRTDGYLAR